MINVFERYDDYIIATETKKFQTSDTQNLNTVNTETVFDINCGDSFLNMKNAVYDIKGKYVDKNGSPYASGTNTVKLVDNFVPHLFKSVILKKDDYIVDKVENVGRVSTMYGTITSGEMLNDACSGFKSTWSGGGKFQALGLLSNFGLGFLQDLSFPVYKGGFQILFERNNDDDALYHWKTATVGAVEPEDGKIIIEEFTIWIPIIKYKSEHRTKLIQELQTLSKKREYKFYCKSLHCYVDKKIPNELTYSRDINNVRAPIFVFVGFQTNKYQDQKKDSAVFDHCNVKNIRVDIDGVSYPENVPDYDFSSQCFLQAYERFKSYAKTFRIKPLPPLSPKEFLDSKPFYVFDLTRRPENLDGSKSNITLRADFAKNVPENTYCYIVFVTLKQFVSDIVEGTTQEVLM